MSNEWNTYIRRIADIDKNWFPLHKPCINTPDNSNDFRYMHIHILLKLALAINITEWKHFKIFEN